jgi:cytochrome b subunit of formate dehydrogenase
LGAWGLLLTGQVLWLTYGVATAEWAIVIVNIVAAASSTAILIVESRNRRRVNAA